MPEGSQPTLWAGCCRPTVSITSTVYLTSLRLNAGSLNLVESTRVATTRSAIEIYFQKALFLLEACLHHCRPHHLLDFLLPLVAEPLHRISGQRSSCRKAARGRSRHTRTNGRQGTRHPNLLRHARRDSPRSVGPDLLRRRQRQIRET